MKNETKSLLKKSAKIAGVTCFSAGAVALITSGAALKAITEGGKYLVDTVKKIVTEEDVAPKAQGCPEVIFDEDFAVAEDTPVEDAPAEAQI